MMETNTNGISTTDFKQKGVSSLVIVMLVFSIVVAGFGAWSFYSYQQVKKEIIILSTIEGQKALQEKEVSELISAVGKLLVLPEGEEPIVATISDITVLADKQPFFEKASNGDKILVYTQAGKAIIYSPERNIIINVGEVVVDNN